MAKKRKAKTKRQKQHAAIKQGMVLSVFADPDQAQKALDGLRYAGIRPDQIWCTAPGGDTNMLSSLESLDLPDQEVDFYTRACEAGHTVVLVHAVAQKLEVSVLLHRDGGYDFNAQALQPGSHASTAHTDTQGKPGIKRHNRKVTIGPHKVA